MKVLLAGSVCKFWQDQLVGLTNPLFYSLPAQLVCTSLVPRQLFATAGVKNAVWERDYSAWVRDDK